MRTKIILSFIVFNVLLVTGKNSTVETLLTNIHPEKSSMEVYINANPTIYLTPIKHKNIKGIDVQNAFFNGWQFDKYTDIYGYTATDDLWTFLNPGNAASNNYDAVRIEVFGFEVGSPEWNYCMSDINQVANNLALNVAVD